MFFVNCWRTMIGQRVSPAERHKAKVAALGIRVSRGCAFHGLSLNVDMDLAPFAAIDPCGYPGLRVTQTRDLGMTDSKEALGRKLAGLLIRNLGHA